MELIIMYNNIFSGNACFLVNFEDDKYIKKNFISYLKDEGFRQTIGIYNTSHYHWLFINVNSMVFWWWILETCQSYQNDSW